MQTGNLFIYYISTVTKVFAYLDFVSLISAPVQSNVNQTTTTKRLTSIRLLEIQKQVFEFNLSINSVTHGKIMSAQYYEPTTTFPLKIMSGEPPYPPSHVSAQH